MEGFTSSTNLGLVEVLALQNRGMNIEEIAELMTRKLVHVADSAPPVIREQAIEFRQRILVLSAHYLRQAVRSHQTTLWNMLVEEGHMEAAEIVIRNQV